MGLDAVEIIMGWEESFGITIADREAESLRTPHQAIDLIATKLNTREGADQTCFTLRAFNRLRRSLVHTARVSRDGVRPETLLKNLVIIKRRRIWDAVRMNSGVASLPKPGFFWPRTVGDLVHWMAAYAAKDLKSPSESWTRLEIRSVVRAVISDVVLVTDFDDRDDFVRDIGVT